MTSGLARVNGVELYFDDVGAGAVVVLAHAGISDSRMWDAQVDVLASTYRVLRYDLRGFGRSGAPPGAYAHWRDLLALLDARGIDQAHLVGVSIAAAAVASLAIQAPPRVLSLTLVAAGFAAEGGPSPAVQQYWADEEAALARGDMDAAIELNMAFWVYGPRRAAHEVEPEFRQRARDLLAFNLARGEIDGEQVPLDPPLGERLTELTMPTLVVYGDQDVDHVLESGERLYQKLPDVRRSILAGTAHLPSLEQPAAFNAILLEFLGQRA
jgi:pimeloyl-ACP methyl ester carboxylesterase